MVKLVLEQLNRSRHERTGFDCGNDEVNNFLRKSANKLQIQQASQTYVLVKEEQTAGLQPIVGFFTLTYSEIRREETPSDEEMKKFPRFPLPAIRLAWLGVDSQYQNTKDRIGAAVLLLALGEAYRIVSNSGLGVAVIVDPLTKQSDSFFKRYGFQEMERDFGNLKSLYIRMTTVKDMLQI
ncbi:acetyltransferase [Hahella sp. KA22]|uniref:acetyltransferase n=1 Tax=Hahella sp. KA22 TaxID=1628392 RepID=UPI000FDEA04A|nr:acetyltransferase [Hahella sp. KA22]AZZ94669.1 acetyltransferase [Hahella sp. KA22]QAY58042.1 acetyltransferase [Hahella sp. KA22]